MLHGLDLPHVAVVHAHVYALLSRVLERVAHLRARAHTHTHTHTHHALTHTHIHTSVYLHLFCAHARVFCSHARVISVEQRFGLLAPHPHLEKATSTNFQQTQESL